MIVQGRDTGWQEAHYDRSVRKIGFDIILRIDDYGHSDIGVDAYFEDLRKGTIITNNFHHTREVAAQTQAEDWLYSKIPEHVPFNPDLPRYDALLLLPGKKGRKGSRAVKYRNKEPFVLAKK